MRYSFNPSGVHREPLEYIGSMYEGKSTAAGIMSVTSISSKCLGSMFRLAESFQSEILITFKFRHEWVKSMSSCLLMYFAAG
jgi:hypothetical protein